MRQCKPQLLRNGLPCPPISSLKWLCEAARPSCAHQPAGTFLANLVTAIREISAQFVLSPSTSPFLSPFQRDERVPRARGNLAVVPPTQFKLLSRVARSLFSRVWRAIDSDRFLVADAPFQLITTPGYLASRKLSLDYEYVNDGFF